MTVSAGLSQSTRERLVPIAEGIEAFTRNSGRAFVERDGDLARGLLADGGERERINSELDAAWTDLLSDTPADSGTMKASVGLIVSLRGIADRAATILDKVAELAARKARAGSDQPAMDKLALMVPNMVQGAVNALRDGDRESADEVLKKGVSVDVAFAQTYHEVMQLVRVNGADYDVAKDLNAISQAFERIGDGATEIASSVRLALA